MGQKFLADYAAGAMNQAAFGVGVHHPRIA
jgi:hypothetical protein